MTSVTQPFPFYAKLAFSLISLIAIFFILYIGQGILVPLLLAGLFSILLGPIHNFLKFKLRFPTVLASIITVVLFVLFFVGIGFFLSWQIGDMMSDWGKIKRNLGIHLHRLQGMVRDNFNLSEREQNEMINSAATDTGRQIVGNTLISVSDTLASIILLPIYTFLMLYYRNHFKKFLCKLFKKEHHAKLQEIMTQIRVSVQSYIVGLFGEMIIVSVLTSTGYYIIGIEYAFLLGVITGLLNLIPYIGIAMACVLSIVASLSGSTDLSIIVGVVSVNVVVQFLDNNILVPMIVSSKVKINALVSIVAIIIGGAIAGIAGMFLAIPVTAIIKVIFDRIDALSAWGYLMGDDIPKTFTWHRMRFPLYAADHAPDPVVTTTSNPEPQQITFTETKTDPTIEIKNKNGSS